MCESFIFPGCCLLKRLARSCAPTCSHSGTPQLHAGGILFPQVRVEVERFFHEVGGIGQTALLACDAKSLACHVADTAVILEGAF